MLRIAVIQRFLPSRSRGGVGYFTHGLCNALQRRGHRVTVFSQDPAPDGATYRVKILRPGVRFGKLGIFSFPFQVAKQDFTSFDVIHAQGDDHLLSRTDTPVIRTMHGSSFAEAIHNGWKAFSPKHLLLHLYFYGCELISNYRADVTAVVSKDTSRYYPSEHPVVPNGIALENFTCDAGVKSHAPSILFVGELHTRKRGRLLLDVFRSEVRRQLPDAELWLVTPDGVAESDGVRHFSQVDSDWLARLYAQAWLFCLPSSYEGFGRPYVEAMASGTPVVATPNAGAKEVLRNGEYGLIVRESELGAGLLRMLKDAAVRDVYRERGLQRAQEYSWSKVVLQYERLYDSVLQKRAKLRIA